MITFSKFNLKNFSDKLIITDNTLAQLYGINSGNVVYIPEGEAAKTFAVAENLCREFLHRNLQRSNTVVAVGGGSVGDAAGFAASIFKRGVKLLHVPTTLLAMIDSSIGGKTALNLDSVKNVVGTFHAADTLVDTTFLKTLPQVQLDNAAGEIEKYRLLSKEIDDAANDLPKLIKLCASYKEKIVNADFFDTAVRRQLNMGHTVGHALELQYSLPHGQAVLLGLHHEMRLAVKLSLLSDEFLQGWTSRNKIDTASFPLNTFTVEKMQNDKKNSGGKISFVLPAGNYNWQSVLLSGWEVLQLLC